MSGIPACAALAGPYRVSATTSAFSLQPNTRLTPSMPSSSLRLSSALQPVTIILASGLTLCTLRIRLRDLLSEVAVTEQVFTR